jgi:hypothetical protein
MNLKKLRKMRLLLLLLSQPKRQWKRENKKVLFLEKYFLVRSQYLNIKALFTDPIFSDFFFVIYWRKTNFHLNFSDEEEDELEEASEDEAPPVVAKPTKKAMKKGKQKT